TAAKEAGLDTIPGTAAEILDDEVRWILTKGKLPAATWIEVVTTAHELGIRSSSTMMYGHVDQPRHWLGHLRTLARIQQETGGFTEFVTLPFVHTNAPVYLAGIARPGPTVRDNRAVTAMARLLLHPHIPNIQTSPGTGSATCASSPAASRRRAASPSSSPCPSCTPTRPSTWPASPAPAPRSATTVRSPRWPGCCSTRTSPTSRLAG